MTKLKSFILFMLLQVFYAQNAWACIGGDRIAPLVPLYVIVGIAMACLLVGYFFFVCFNPTTFGQFVNEYWQGSLTSEKKLPLFKNLFMLYLMVYTLCLLIIIIYVEWADYVEWLELVQWLELVAMIVSFVITFLLCRKAKCCAPALKLWWRILFSICASLLSFLLLYMFVTVDLCIAYDFGRDTKDAEVSFICYVELILVGFYLYCKKVSRESSVHKKLYIAGMALLAVVSIVAPIIIRYNFGKHFSFREYSFVAMMFYLICYGVQQVKNCKEDTGKKVAWVFFCILIVGISGYWLMTLNHQLFLKDYNPCPTCDCM